MDKTTPVEILQAAADSIEPLLRVLKKSNTTQVRSKEELQLIKATALAWFNNYKKQLRAQDESLVKDIDEEYSQLFESVSKATSRNKYIEILKKIKKSVSNLQSKFLKQSLDAFKPVLSKPDFSPLTPNARMQSILENRWEEILRCLNCDAPLAATIMMGGLLEALFLAFVNKMPDKGPVFKAKTAPKDYISKKTLPLNEWTLSSYIDVAAELSWITKPTKDVGVVLRNYRNFIHPERELSTGITLLPGDAQMFWSVSVQLTNQIIFKAKSIT